MTIIKEVLTAVLKLETSNEFFIGKNELTIKLNEKMQRLVSKIF